MLQGEYTWIFALGMIFAFMDAYGIGANDVANSFATSVGSRSLTLGQACGIAVFTEFGGAVLLGASTTVHNVAYLGNNQVEDYRCLALQEHPASTYAYFPLCTHCIFYMGHLC